MNSSINPSDFQLDMSFFSDNTVNNIFVNNAGQAANYPTVLPQSGGSNTYSFKGFQAANGVDISLSKDWKACENEIIVEVHSGSPYMGFLAQNTNKCYEAEIPEYTPQIDIKWGDSKCDCLESDDLETMCLTVCNPYSNIDFSGFKIGKLEIFDEKEKPVGALPNGDPSIAIVAAGPFCFGDIATCSCVSREFVLVNRGAIRGKYKVRVSGICSDVCHHYLLDECLELEICQD